MRAFCSHLFTLFVVHRKPYLKSAYATQEAKEKKPQSLFALVRCSGCSLQTLRLLGMCNFGRHGDVEIRCRSCYRYMRQMKDAREKVGYRTPSKSQCKMGKKSRWMLLLLTLIQGKQQRNKQIYLNRI